MKCLKNYFLKKYLKNYYKLYANGKTPTAKDISKAIVKDLNKV